MKNENLRIISNNFQEVRLVSLASWRQADEIKPRDRGGPYLVMQEGFDPQDLQMIADEFVIGRSGKWISLSHFFQFPMAKRREEFVFGTAAEVMKMMRDLPSKVSMLSVTEQSGPLAASLETDELMSALKAGKQNHRD